MASRQEIHRSKLKLKNELRAKCQEGHLLPGDPAPSLRDLAEQYSISTPTVTQALQELVDEGLLHTIARVGTFVGVQKTSFENYLILDDGRYAHTVRDQQFRLGFEERITQLGGASLKVTPGQLTAALNAGDLPAVGGVFELNWMPEEFWDNPLLHGVSRVRFCPFVLNDGSYDCVSFDDENGGRQATQHLLSLGHQRVAFLGLHSKKQHDVRLDWSRARENGWREAMMQAALPIEDLFFEPLVEPHNESDDTEIEAVLQASLNLVQRSDVSAVVAANDHAAIGLIRALRAAGVPTHKWPSIVGFDDDPIASEHLVTSFRLPWDELGRSAAELLWERRQGRLPRQSQHRPIPMRLIARLTCRKNWSTTAGTTILETVAA